MKEALRRIVDGSHPASDAPLNVREYLQARILEALQRTGAMVPLSFHGGTALRFLFSIPRFSEDLDFTLERPGFDLPASASSIKSTFRSEGYDVEVKLNCSSTVHNALVRFRGLLHELGLSGHQGQVLAIKIEVDTRPPAGASLETTIVRRHVTLNLQHHDRASLLAGKLHALLQRPYTKGRDVFDLFWYLSDRTWPEPNLSLLNNALEQTGWQHGPLDERAWRPAVRERLDDIDWKTVHRELGIFVDGSFDVNLVSRSNLVKLLRSG